MVIILVFLLSFNLFKCTSNTETNYYYGYKLKSSALTSSFKNSSDCYYDSLFRKSGLVDISEIIPGIIIDLKYSTERNYWKKDFYGCLEKAYLQPDVALKLKKSYEYLKSINPYLTLIVYDAARPVEIQKLMWEMLDMPIREKIKYLGKPDEVSLHNYGAAVDVTLGYLDGTPLDMGVDFDSFTDLSSPQKEEIFLKKAFFQKANYTTENC